MTMFEGGKPRLFTLKGRIPVRTDDVVEATGKCRHVAIADIGDVHISTVFLGLDHRHGDGTPLLFETIIFGGEHDQWQERCSTWEEAEAMHERAVAMVRAVTPEEPA